MRQISYSVGAGLLAAAFGSGCLAYNEQCQGFVEKPGEVVGYTAETIYLDKPNARHDTNAIGQLEADAFVDAFASSERPAAFGVANGGAVRAEGLCVTRNILAPGPMTNGLLHEILLFENLVKAVDVTEPEVLAMMEHSVERLQPDGQAINAPAGQFLQVSASVKLTVDCSKPAGGRVTSLKIGNDTLARPGNPAKRYRVALTAFLLGGDGFDMLQGLDANPDRDPVQAQRFGGTDANTAADYMRRNYNADPAKGLKRDTGRTTFVGCAKPPPPPS